MLRSSGETNGTVSKTHK